MAFVEMVERSAIVAERLEHRGAAESEDALLTEAIVVVAAVEAIGEGLIPRRVFRKRRVEQKHRHLVSADALDDVFPGTDANVASLELHRDDDVEGLEELFGTPFDRALGLIAFGVDVLLEVAFALQQGDADHRDLEVGRGPEGVSGENAKSAAVRGDRLLEADLH